MRFAKPDSNEFVLVFMSDGLVFCLEYLTDSFTFNDKGAHDIARLAKYPVMDMDEGFILSVGEDGKNGCYHKVELFKENKKSSGSLRGIKLEMIAEFKINSVKKTKVSSYF